MMDDYCKECHADTHGAWSHSVHRFSSFNNPAYRFSVRETRKVGLEQDGTVQSSRFCAGCHDPVPFFSGAFDNVSVVVRQSLVQLLTPDSLRGRVTAVNQIFIGSSNEIGALRAGLMSAMIGPVAEGVAAVTAADLDGVDVITRLRAQSTVPILVLSGRSDSADKVDALDAGHVREELRRRVQGPRRLAEDGSADRLDVRVGRVEGRAGRTNRGDAAVGSAARWTHRRHGQRHQGRGSRQTFPFELH